MKDLFDNEEIRSLSWKQPYADLMLQGKIETRTWDTKYRGKVLICVSKKIYNFSELYSTSGAQVERIENILEKEESFFCKENITDEFITGMAIAVGTLVDTRKMTKEDEDDCFVKFYPPWTDHRVNKIGKTKEVIMRLYCHIYKDVQPILPFPWKGSQGWKTLNQEEKNKIILL